MKRTVILLVCGLAFLSCTRPKPAALPETKTQNANGGRHEAASEGNAVELTPEAQQRAGVTVTPAAVIPMTQYLQVTGSVQPVDSSVAHVRPLARGRLQEVLVKAGDRVASGQVLAQLDTIEAGELAAQYNSALSELQRFKIQMAAQQRQVERNRRLVEIGAAPQKDYEFSLAEEQALEEKIRGQESAVSGLSARLRRFGINQAEGNPSPVTAIRAPFSGVIIRTAAAPGEVVDPGAEMFSLADLSSVYVQAQVYEKDLGRVRAGQPASITLDSYPGEHFPSRVVSISDLVDPQTRSAAVRCQVSNSDGRLKLDMLAMIRFPTSTKRAALSVPADAVQTIEGKSVVFVRGSPYRFSIRPVEAGLTSEGRTEILRGLNEGEPVVSKGAFALKSVLLVRKLGEKE